MSGLGDQIREPPTQVDVASPSRPIVVSLAWDIVLNATIPVVCYWFSKRFVSRSELTALLVATAFPLLKSGYALTRHREVDPVALLVLLGIATSMLALVMGGDPRLLLIRESFFTGAFGIACLISLTFPRPIMFYRASAPIVLVVSPFLTGAATILTVIWTFGYAFRVRAQIAR